MNDGFSPVYTKESKVLILGTFPSVKSRQAGFYYGNPQNRFWKMLGQVFSEPIANSVEEKIAFLKRHNIALFDVFTKSDLKGSADSTLAKSNSVVAQLSFLLPPATKIEKILCNGKLAYNTCIEQNLPVPVLYMPSTSPANPRYTIDEWQKELEFLK